jgi:hypothetical protein
VLDYLTGWRRNAWCFCLGAVLGLLAWALTVELAWAVWLAAVWMTHG